MGRDMSQIPTQTTWEKQWTMEEMEKIKKKLGSEYLNYEATIEGFDEDRPEDQ